MKKIFLCLILILANLLLPRVRAKTEVNANLVHQIQSTYESAKDISSTFVQKVKIAALEREVEKTGKTFFKKPGKMRIEYDGKDGRQYISNGKILWIYEPGDSQVQVQALKEGGLPQEALAFLGGLGNLEKQFQVRPPTPAERKEKNLTPSLDWLMLKPKNTQSTLQEMFLGFNPTTHLVWEGYLKNETGNENHYLFKNVKTNTNLEENLFEFKKPKGVKEVKHE